MFNATQILILMIMALLLLGLAAVWLLRGSTRAALASPSSPRSSFESWPVNPSFLLALLFWLALGYFLGVPLSRGIANTLGLRGTFLIHGSVALAVTALGMLWVTHNTPTRNKSAVKFFYTKLWRMGPGGKGFEEGLNATPLGRPFFIVEDHSIQEEAEPFDQMKAYSLDKQPVKVTGTYNRYISDVYDWYNIEDEAEAVQSLNSMVLKQVRIAVESYGAADLISHEAGVAVKETIGKKAYEAIQRELQSGNANWGYDIRPTLQIADIDLDARTEQALQREELENIEGRFEQTQINRRLDQIQALKDKGMNADLAAAFTQIEADKAGAKMNTINIPGMQGIGEAFGNAGKAFSDWLRTKTPT